MFYENSEAFDFCEMNDFFNDLLKLNVMSIQSKSFFRRMHKYIQPIARKIKLL